jgi:glutathione S-transferase
MGPIKGEVFVLTLFYAPGACSMAAHVVLEESGEPYKTVRLDLQRGDQHSLEYLMVNAERRVPTLEIEPGRYLTENVAILPYLGKRHGLWPLEPIADAFAMARLGYFATTVHPAYAHARRPERICRPLLVVGRILCT